MTCRACEECDGKHHFAESTLNTSDGDEAHPAALAGHLMWYGCKHCPSWAEIDDDDGEMKPGAVHEVVA